MELNSENDAYIMLNKIGVLGKENVQIKDKKSVENIVSFIIKGGYNKLQLIVDFDYTLTKGRFDGESNISSWGIIDSSPYVPEFYKEVSQQLFEKYYPIEIDDKINEEEKIPHMCEWYNLVMELLKKCNVQKDTIVKMVKESNIHLRDDTEILFNSMKENGVPILIFSAGLGDVLEQVLFHFDIYSNNVKIVSNFFKYDDQGVMIDFVGEQIHMFNKNENAIHSSDYFSLLEKRTNVILMGDTIGDTKMAVGVPQPNNVLKIGFLNEKVTERLDSYMDAFDIVLIKDRTMNVANSIISNMLS